MWSVLTPLNSNILVDHKILIKVVNCTKQTLRRLYDFAVRSDVST